MALRTKAEMVEEVKALLEETGCEKVSKKQAQEVLEGLCEAIIAELKEGGDVTLPGIGKLKVVETSARSGKIVTKTGETKEWKKPAGKKVKLEASKSLKEAVK